MAAQAVLNPDDNQGPMLLATIWVLYSLALVCFAVRFGSRLYDRFKLTAADYTVAVAMLLMTAEMGLMTAAVDKGFGRHQVYIYANLPSVLRFNLGVFMAGMGASCWARVSIACLLLQFTTDRLWRVLIWATMVLNVLDFLAYEIVYLTSCSSWWSLNISSTKGTRCLAPAHVWGFTYAAIVVAMVSDFICALVPVVLIRRLSRSKVERALISVLMASSLVASGCGIAKLYYMITFDFDSPDGLYQAIPEYFWCRVEEAVIIIAACVPLLKSPVERLLHRLGVSPFRMLPPYLNRIELSPPSGPSDDSSKTRTTAAVSGDVESAGGGSEGSRAENGSAESAPSQTTQAR